MKTWFVLLFVCTMHLNASNLYSQQKKMDISMKNASLVDVFRYIRQNSDYTFVYDSDAVKQMKTVSLDMKNVAIEEILEQCFKGSPFVYLIEGNLVIVKEQKGEQQQAKSIRVKGFVYDMKKQPIPGVTVKIVGVSLGTATNEKGWFALDLPMTKGVLEFSFVGYKSKTVEFTEKTTKDTLRITLEEEVQALDEAIVVAYGTTTKRETTGLISVIKGDDLKGIPSANIASLLQGRVAGMDITQMSGSPGGGGTSIVIRGYNSLDVEQGRRFSNPLWVVDGVPLNSFSSPVTGTNLLADINPDMIESVQVLKDASAASLYGSRAANGVIIVTTKKGKKEQDATFSVNVSQSWGQLPRLPGVTIGRLEREMRLLATQRSFVAYLDPETKMYRYPVSLKEVYDTRKGSIDGYWIPAPGTDTNNGLWRQDSLNPFYNNATNFFPMYYETAKIMNANIQAYGGSERMMYGLGLGYYDEGGILKGTGYKRVDLNANLNVIPVKRFNVDLRFNASLVNRKRGTNAGGMLSSAPSVETVPGDPFELSTLMPGAGSVAWNAALENLRGTKESNRNIRLRTNFKLSYQIVDGLDLSTSLSADYSIARRNYFQPSYLDNDGYSLSVGETGINLMVLNENLLSYKKQFGEEHKLSFMAGLSYQYDQMEYNGGYAKNSPSNKIYYAPSGLPSYGTQESHGTTRVIVFKSYQSDMQEKALVSYFGRLEYSFRDKYLFTMAYRRDGSSTFGANHRWGSFPSVAVGWSFSEESFIKDRLGWLSFGKIRASWGRSGMHFDYPYLALGIVENGPNYEGNGTLTPNFLDGMYNEDLSWENTDQYDIGLDLDFFNYRLGVVLDYYYRYTDDMLMQVPLSSPNMYSLQWRNAAAISNEGVEILVKGDILSKPDLYWRVSVNWAKNWNRFRKSYSGFDENGWIIGKPLNGIYVMKTNGFVNEQNELPIEYNNSQGWRSYTHGGDPTLYFKPGDLKFVDVNGDGVCDYKDLVYAGSALPFCNGGIVNELRWKNWDMAFPVVYQLGRHVINTLPFNNFRSGANPFVMDIGGTKFWEKPGDDAEYPSWENALLDHFNAKCDRYVEKVNWLKMKTLTVGYTMPERWMKKLGMKELRVFASGENLFTWDNYSGLDPETVNITSGNDAGRNYPLARKWTLGLTLKF
ncbi:SusC/RagA family TonB-linked outer membrane protein [Butyricimonas faecalis]|uniref:SusC/RagA family TonB-linked outer membrane protein n=1 Tax=Butyricimonas faecalis TaxID=2093856 RepID=UPI001E4FB9E7|nr:SusC/RagA family TonB-linked outer membrane protein [Butyricimonas faecalis]